MSSLLMVVQNAQPSEQLPAYRRDPETSSIRSSAPSYVSEAPTYHSTVPAPRANTQRIGLPPANYAPGFIGVRSVDRNGLTHLNFTMNQWSSIYSSPQARHYHNVATRRTNLAMIEEQNLLATLSSQLSLPTFPVVSPASTEATIINTATVSSSALAVEQLSANVSNISSTQPAASSGTNASNLASGAAATHGTIITSTIEHLPPLEDPDLVGHVAARVARERRLYIARETQIRREQEELEAVALREESRRWDFLLEQMADWEERERGWKVFSKKLQDKTAKRNGAKKILFRFWK